MFKASDNSTSVKYTRSDAQHIHTKVYMLLFNNDFKITHIVSIPNEHITERIIKDICNSFKCRCFFAVRIFKSNNTTFDTMVLNTTPEILISGICISMNARHIFIMEAIISL